MDKHFIDQCEREELHLSGAIQGHGTLLVANQQNLLTHLAANIHDFLPADLVPALQKPLPEPFAGWAAELEAQTGKRLRLSGVLGGKHAQLDVVLTRNPQGSLTIELGTSLDDEPVTAPGFPGLERPSDAADLLRQQQMLTQRVFQLSGFQRVMFYRFRDSGDGEVLAEARQPEIFGSYLGLRFPASDIPHIARLLYLLNPWRLIPDATAPPVPIIGRHDEVPDLSHTDLRSVSPIHALYLSNMGVRASLSFPLVVGNDLWGLIACHHSQPHHISLARLSAISQEVRAHMMSFSAYSSQQRIQMTEGLSRRFGELRNLIYRAGDILSAWPEMAPWLAREFSADGATVCLGTQKIESGICFEAHPFEVFDSWFVQTQNEPLWLGDRLNRQIPGFEFSHVAGALAVKVKVANNEYLRIYLTRQEHIYEVAWGGNPEKPIEYNTGTIGIAPRRSFEKWIEKRIGRSRPWENEARLLGLKLREFLIEISHHA